MSGQPWGKFYWSDWRSDPRLRMCGLAARGLWIEMLSLMNEAEPFGHLIIAGRRPSDMQLAVLVGAGEDEVRELITELESAGVFSRNKEGVIYSRRMTQDEKKAKIARKNGKSGGNPTLCKTREISASDNQQDKLPDKGGVKAQKPEARSQKEAKASLEGNALKDFGDSVLDAFGITPQSFLGHFGPLRDLERQGHSLETILAIAKRIASRDGFVLRGNPIALLTKAFPDELAKMLAQQRINAPVEFVDRLAEKWRQRVDRFKNVSGFWHDGWGPKPGEIGCECPAAILAEFGYEGLRNVG